MAWCLPFIPPSLGHPGWPLALTLPLMGCVATDQWLYLCVFCVCMILRGFEPSPRCSKGSSLGIRQGLGAPRCISNVPPSCSGAGSRHCKRLSPHSYAPEVPVPGPTGQTVLGACRDCLSPVTSGSLPRKGVSCPLALMVVVEGGDGLGACRRRAP